MPEGLVVPDTRSSKLRAALLGAARVLITGASFFLLVTRVDFHHAISLLHKMSKVYFISAILVMLVAVMVGTVRWHFILAAQRQSPGVIALLKLAFTGLFFNQFLPSGIGGDAVRAWRCRDFGVELPIAIRSVVLDRISGYVVLVALFAVTLPTLLRTMPGLQEREFIVALFAASSALMVACGAADLLPTFFKRIPGFGAIALLSRDARQLFDCPVRVSSILGLSTTAIILTTLGCMLVGQGLGAELSFGSWLMIIAPITVMQLMPVTLAGWGVREIGLVSVLPVFGTSAEAALAISILIGLVMVAAALPGAVIWLTGFDRAGTRTKMAGKAGLR